MLLGPIIYFHHTTDVLVVKRDTAQGPEAAWRQGSGLLFREKSRRSRWIAVLAGPLGRGHCSESGRPNVLLWRRRCGSIPASAGGGTCAAHRVERRAVFVYGTQDDASPLPVRPCSPRAKPPLRDALIPIRIHHIRRPGVCTCTRVGGKSRFVPEQPALPARAGCGAEQPPSAPARRIRALEPQPPPGQRVAYARGTQWPG